MSRGGRKTAPADAPSSQASLQPSRSLSFGLVAIRGAEHGFSRRKVSCDLPRTTDFHQAIAEDLGTFAPWVFAFLVKNSYHFDPSRSGVGYDPWRLAKFRKKAMRYRALAGRVGAQTRPQNLWSKFRSNLKSSGRGQTRPQPRLRGDRSQRSGVCSAPEPTDPPMAAALRMRSRRSSRTQGVIGKAAKSLTLKIFS